MADGCDVHGYHSPKPLRLVVHHIQPKVMGGSDLPANKVTTCDTGHMNIHRLLGDLLHGNKMRWGTRRERALALQGYGAWVNAGKPGHPVYEVEHP